MRASIRGIDLILEQGMNVKVLTFPEGDDPDSFAKKVSTQELKDYLAHNAQDFINFKVSLLMGEAKNDPVKKAGLIRDIVTSISKIPDNIQREVYVQECARILEISESVLFNELAQISKKNEREAYQKKQQARRQQERTKQPSGMPATQKSDAHSDEEAYFQHMIAEQQGAAPTVVAGGKPKGINTLDLLEQEIIKILLLYGNEQVAFVDWVEEVNDLGQVKLIKDEYSNLVSQELYLQLQDDEIEFANPVFKKVYLEIVTQLNQEKPISMEELTSHQDPEIAQVVTDILMDDEKYVLSNWESKEIYVTSKVEKLSKLVLDAIWNLRRVLIELKIKELVQEVSSAETRESALEMVVSYTELKKKLFEKLHRIL
jgi:DNA primase